MSAPVHRAEALFLGAIRARFEVRDGARVTVYEFTFKPEQAVAFHEQLGRAITEAGKLGNA